MQTIGTFIIYVEDAFGAIRQARTHKGLARDGIQQVKRELAAKGDFDNDVWAVPVQANAYENN